MAFPFSYVGNSAGQDPPSDSATGGKGTSFALQMGRPALFSKLYILVTVWVSTENPLEKEGPKVSAG